MTTRGIRNCNPMNIVKGAAWKGRRTKQTDKKFVQFTEMKWGIRAAIIILRTYVTKHNLRSVREIISRWAPPSDGNATDAYIQYVRNYVDFASSGSPIQGWNYSVDDGYLFSKYDFLVYDGMMSPQLLAMVQAMCQIESQYHVSDREVREALNLM